MKHRGNTTIKLWGYQIEKETFTIKENEAKVITFIFDSYLQGLRYKLIIQMLKDNRFYHRREMKSGVNQRLKRYLPMENIQVIICFKRHSTENR